MVKLTPDEAQARIRLQELAKQRGVSLAGLSEMIGRNSSYLQQYMGRGSPRRLEERDRRVLAEFFGIGESELGGPKENSYSGAAARTSSPGDYVDIPRLPLGASAGPGALAGEELPFDNFRFSRRWLREQGLEPGQLSAITVEGDSMEPLLRNGDEILVDRSPRPLRDGIHVLRLGESLLVKRVAQAAPGRVTLLSQNLAYPPVEVALDEVEVIGRVVWKGGRV